MPSRVHGRVGHPSSPANPACAQHDQGWSAGFPGRAFANDPTIRSAQAARLWPPRSSARTIWAPGMNSCPRCMDSMSSTVRSTTERLRRTELPDYPKAPEFPNFLAIRPGGVLDARPRRWTTRRWIALRQGRQTTSVDTGR